jgi:hypothetical protein
MWSYNYTYPNYLAHYGVLGMKWGVRRKETQRMIDEMFETGPVIVRKNL